VLKAYRQFLFLKKHNEDWDAKLLSPSFLVDQMWHQHILDVVNYCHDMMLICGHVVGHNPDGALDIDGKKSRDERTRDGLNEHFEGEHDCEVWGMSVRSESEAVQANDNIQVDSLAGNENRVASVASGSGVMTTDADVSVVSNDEDDVFETIQLRLVHTGCVASYRLHRYSRLSTCFMLYTRAQNKSKGPGDFIFKYNGSKVDGRRTLNSLSSLGLKEDGKLFQIFVQYKNEDDRIAAERREFENQQITIRVTDQAGEETLFKVKMKTKLRIICDTYASRKGVHVDKLRFFYEGSRISYHDTPLSFHMEDQDRIDVFFEQIGC
jgi:hypothetical protein